jgi:hypothetical protein
MLRPLQSNRLDGFQACRLAQAALFVSLTAGGISRAASPEAEYLAARNRANAVEQKAQAASSEPSAAQEARLWSDIKAPLRLLVGSDPPKGFSGPATINPEKLLYGDIGSQSLAGFRWAAKDRVGSVLVTTYGLLRRWLYSERPEHLNANIPTDLKSALRTNSFYTQAITLYYPVTIIEPLSIQTPAGAKDVFAQLMDAPRDKSSGVPNIAIVLRKGDRVCIGLVEAKTHITPFPDCGSARRALEKQPFGAPLNDQKAIDEADRVEAEAEARFRICWTDQIDRQRILPALTKEAQHIADDLADSDERRSQPRQSTSYTPISTPSGWRAPAPMNSDRISHE